MMIEFQSKLIVFENPRVGGFPRGLFHDCGEIITLGPSVGEATFDQAIKQQSKSRRLPTKKEVCFMIACGAIEINFGYGSEGDWFWTSSIEGVEAWAFDGSECTLSVLPIKEPQEAGVRFLAVKNDD